MYSFKAIKTPRVSEEVAEQIKQAILQRHFRVGEKLPAERQLAEDFQVSRVAVREALRLLDNSGFITTRQGAGGGAFVTDLTLENISQAFLDLFLVGKFSIPELCQARLLLDPEVARLAAENITPDFARKLKAAIEAEEQPIRSLSEDLDIKIQVHVLLMEMCGNRLYQTLQRLLLGITRMVVVASGPDPEIVHPAGMHRPVVEAVLAGDPEAAAEAMKRHTIEFGENLLKMEDAYRQKFASGEWTPARG
ncbi:MAG: FadR family transcriptional regulator [Proteobacteria bacterium]|nr:FadR family transcriptional regulator [Pseudomonadota bacterium]MBU1742200.1 FadR family transcriptional regulator [Pseudomonadota bacterium]